MGIDKDKKGKNHIKQKHQKQRGQLWLHSLRHTCPMDFKVRESSACKALACKQSVTTKHGQRGVYCSHLSGHTRAYSSAESKSQIYSISTMDFSRGKKGKKTQTFFLGSNLISLSLYMQKVAFIHNIFELQAFRGFSSCIFIDSK